MRIEHSLDIPAPVERVWDLTVDLPGWPRINPTVQSLEMVTDAPLSVGSQARIKQRGQSERTWTVTRLEEPHHFEWETRVGSIRMAGIHHLVETEGGCRNHLAVELTGRGSGLLGRLLGRQIRRAITLENEGFSTAALAP